MSASFDGSAIWGVAVKMATQPNPPGGQSGAYPGITGVEWLALGGRGRVTQVQGYLTGADAAAFEAACSVIRSYQESGYVGVFVTTTGRAVAYARIVAFQPSPPMGATDGSILAPYSAAVLELV